ncbi:MAG: multiubiquitin domain-containing protein [Clostridia bacterium]|nr:multiubiquitin domain-containing protein [Clostridia bacterium]
MNNEKKEKKIIIYVNGEEKEVNKEKISYEDVIILAFGSYDGSEGVTYTVTYYKGQSHHPNGVLVEGQSVMVKKGMRINVTKTNRS